MKYAKLYIVYKKPFMELTDKIKLLQKLSGLTQAELALKLGVTFVALNRWVNKQARPRPGATQKIDELLLELTGKSQVPASSLSAKKSRIEKLSKHHPHVLQTILSQPDLKDQFTLSLTFHTNRIEGSTLSENETASILFENAVLKGKTLIEQLEVKNHQSALEYLFSHLATKKPLNEALVLRLHAILLNSIHSEAGGYRQHGVRIVGTYVPTANYLKVPELMKKLTKSFQNKTSDLVGNIAKTHATFEKIHPFADGNGRIGRLLMTAMALRGNLAPVVVLQETRRQYLASLNYAQMKEDSSKLEDYVCDAVLTGYDILSRKFTPVSGKPRRTGGSRKKRISQKVRS